jgi:hypothetical protein
MGRSCSTLTEKEVPSSFDHASRYAIWLKLNMFDLIVALLRRNQGRRKSQRRMTWRKSKKLLHPSRQRNKSRLWRPKRWLSRRISPCPRWCESGYPIFQRLQRALIWSNQVKKSRREATRSIPGE